MYRTLKLLHVFFACNDVSIIKKRRAKADVISFDIFDTVLVRKNCMSLVDIFRRLALLPFCRSYKELTLP